ncbi:MAG: MarR family transcriptional regulator [Acidimicrobiales bacterium]|nr:MarR family transcriptional regulator [Acidimicrobiales bacterium]
MSHRSAPRLLVLHGLRLKGFGGPEAIGSVTSLPVEEVGRQLAELQADELVLHREGRLTGWSLTPTGRKEHERLLAEELDQVGCRAEVDGAYRTFLGLNGEMLAVCTSWQVREVAGEQLANDHSDAAYDRAVIDRLVALHDRVRPVVAALRERLERFGGYSVRLRGALEKLLAGQLEWFTRPLIDSYHTVWFELHEDLLATLGIERAKEGQH